MIRKLTHVLAFCLLAIAVAGHAIADDSVRLEYKFTRNELLRYKVVSNMTISMGMDIPGMESMPGGTVQSVAVFRQRTKRILENGDAEIVIAIESMKITIDDQVFHIGTFNKSK